MKNINDRRLDRAGRKAMETGTDLTPHETLKQLSLPTIRATLTPLLALGESIRFQRMSKLSNVCFRL